MDERVQHMTLGYSTTQSRGLRTTSRNPLQLNWIRRFLMQLANHLCNEHACNVVHNCHAPYWCARQFYLRDAAFSISEGYLPSYKGERYHIRQYSNHAGATRGKRELFNYLYSSLHNVVERSFGCWRYDSHCCCNCLGMPLCDNCVLSRHVVPCIIGLGWTKDPTRFFIDIHSQIWSSREKGSLNMMCQVSPSMKKPRKQWCRSRMSWLIWYGAPTSDQFSRLGP